MEPQPEPEVEPPAPDPIAEAMARAAAEVHRIREGARGSTIREGPTSPPARDHQRTRVSATASPASRPASARSSSGSARSSAVYDRLTDPQQFTGAHKHRFGASGEGRGLDGRDSVIKGGGNNSVYMGGAVYDLSQIMRSPRTPSAGGRKSAQPPDGASPQIFDRLTDPSLFTGAHKHRFDKKGQGRGLDGRDYVGKGSGTNSRANAGAVHDLSQITRGHMPQDRPKSARARSGGRGGGRGRDRGRGASGGSRGSGCTPRKNDKIFNKLTDSTQYTGAHKHRFDSKTGKGKGLGGRDSVQKGGGHSAVASYAGGAVHDLSQITRPDFYSAGANASPSRKGKTHSGVSVSEDVPPSPSQTDTEDGIFARLTDPRLFTGAQKQRQAALQTASTGSTEGR